MTAAQSFAYGVIGVFFALGVVGFLFFASVCASRAYDWNERRLERARRYRRRRSS